MYPPYVATRKGVQRVKTWSSADPRNSRSLQHTSRIGNLPTPVEVKGQDKAE